MKIPVIMISLLLASLLSTAQIERQPNVAGKLDTIAFIKSEKNDKMNRKDRLKELDLTKEQKIKLKEIRQSNQAAKAAIENNTGLSEEEKKKQLRALQKEQAQKVQAILTEDQKAKFKANNQNNP
jgi:hypothetical protein